MMKVSYTGGGRIKIRGAISKKSYVFETGKPLYVNKEDVPALLAITKRVGCCGSSRIVSLFARS